MERDDIRLDVIQCLSVSRLNDRMMEKMKDGEMRRTAFTVGTMCTHLSCCVVASVTGFACVCVCKCVCVCVSEKEREREEERDYAGSQKRE